MTDPIGAQEPAALLRAGILVTGTEVLSGMRTDRNGPWLADQLRARGIDPAEIVIVGDRAEDLRAALAEMSARGLQLIVTSGGLGPTADDLTAAVVAEHLGLRMRLDEALRERIRAIVAPLRERFPDLDAEALDAGSTKQALVPEGARVIEPVGTAPGLLLGGSDNRSGVIVVLPGPPRELQPMWDAATKMQPLQGLLEAAERPCHEVMLLFGIPESEIAETLRHAARKGVEMQALEITTCLHRGEVEVSTLFQPSAKGAYEQFAEIVRQRHTRALFSTDGSSVDEQVRDLLLAGGHSIATAESCTAGMLAARLADLPGSSRYLRGGLVTYANEAKSTLAAVPEQLIAEFGAVSAEVAEALARGACESLRASVGVAVTGIAGPEGAMASKPLGTVWLSVVRAPAGGAASSAGAAISAYTRRVQLPGSRADVRDRACTVAMHMIRRALLDGQEQGP